MTVIAHRAKREYVRTKESPTRLSVMLVLILTAFTAGLIVFVRSIPPGLAYGIDRGVPIIIPIETEVCPGGLIHYPTMTFIAPGTKSQVSIAESWCREGLEGSCISVIPSPPNKPLLEPKAIKNERTPRVVPENVTEGTWHLWHSAVDEGGNVAAYIAAPINVVKCEDLQITPTSP